MCSALLASLVCLFAFSGLSIKASAEDTAFLTKQEVRALYGDSIPFTYLSSETGNIESSTFTIQNVNSDFRTVGGWNVQGYPNFNNWEFVYYSSPWGLQVSQVNTEITVQLNPQYSIIDTSSFTSFIGLSSDTDVSASAYSASVWDCRSSVEGDIFGYSPAVSDMYTISGFTGSNRFAVDRFVICPVNFSSQSSGAFSSLSCKFRGCSVSRASGMNQRLYLIVGFPRVTQGFSASSGTVSQTSVSSSDSSGGGSGGGSGSPDLEETNSLIGGVISAIRGIASDIWGGIVGVFVPDESVIEDFKEDIDVLLQDTFAPLYVAGTLTDQVIQQIYTVGDGRLVLPAISVPAVGGNSAFTLISSQNVDLRPHEGQFRVLYETLSAVIDIVCTIAVLNMLRNKIDGILTGEVAVTHVD